MRLALATAAVASTVAGLLPAAMRTETTAPARQTLVDGHGVKWWARRARENGEAVRWQHKRAAAARLRLTVAVAPLEHQYEHAAVLAAVAYGVDAATLIRKGRCESGNWTDFTNPDSDASGPWQFLLSTWATTPFAAFSPFDPLAAALAAAYMHDVGRGGEWSCR